jgi:hypothetical protein
MGWGQSTHNTRVVDRVFARSLQRGVKAPSRALLRAEIFFGAKDRKVIITHLEGHNSTPLIVKWGIPLFEWQS